MPYNEIKKKNVQQKSQLENDNASTAADPKPTPDVVRLRDLANKTGDQFFWSPGGDPYVAIVASDHTETHSLTGKTYQRILASRFFQEFKRPARQSMIQETLFFIESQIPSDVPPREVYTRVAEFDGNVYLDLHAPDWGLICIDQSGWRPIRKAPVHFLRSGTATAQVMPLHADTLDGIGELRQLLNVGSDDSFLLILAWLLSTLNPKGPFPILILYGEQGSAKTSTMRFLRSIIDPSLKEPSTMPRNADDLMIMTRNNWIIDLDNISKITDSQSDDLSRLATGKAFTKRKLYSDSEEIVVSAKRPIIANGIEEFVTRGDLASRSIIIELPVIGGERRMTLRDLEHRLNQFRPKILGALLSAGSVALSRRGSALAPSGERMADAWEFVTAAEPAFGFEPGTFVAAYKRNQELANEVVIQSSAVGEFIIELGKQTWSGPANRLLGELNRLQEIKREKPPKDWPTNPKALSNQLRRLNPAFRKVGIRVELFRSDGSNSQRIIEISMIR